MTCCYRCAAADKFNAPVARRDLRRLRRRGLTLPTRRMLDAVRACPLPNRPTLLDIGGGIGAIHHILLEQGFSSATHVDASPAYLAAATEEAERLGHAGRVQFRLAEFPAEAAGVPPADVVTLDRVVCCYSDYESMLGAAAARARHVLALSYPRSRWLTRMFVTVSNAVRRLRGQAFRVYVHPPLRIHAALEAARMRRAWAGGTWIWAVEVFERNAGTTPGRPGVA